MAKQNKDGITWTHDTWNPVTGCTKVSAGCKHCYAERLFPRVYPGRKFTQVQCHPERLQQPFHWKTPKVIFVNSMSDLFHPDVPDDFIGDVINVIGRCPQHTFQILTKRPERARELFTPEPDRIEELRQIVADAREVVPTWDWPLPNLWLGVSVENQETADERIPILLQTPAALHFVSYEPALGPVDFYSTLGGTQWIGGQRGCRGEHHGIGTPECPTELHHHHDVRCNKGIDWIICGGESGPNARPMHPDWARSTLDQCIAYGVLFFFKQWGDWVPVAQYPGANTTARRVWGTVTHNAFFPKAGPPDTAGNPLITVRLGKKKTGRLLDGQVWDQFPTTRGPCLHPLPAPYQKS